VRTPDASPLVHRLEAAYAGRRVFLTGHTGFKGSWLSLVLARLGAVTTGYALEPPTEPSNFVESGVERVLAEHHIGDIRDLEGLRAAIAAARPEVVLHLAASTIVREGFRDPLETFSTNVMGTATVLEAVRLVGRPCAVVVVSSDKCYANDERGRAFRETDPLGGYDPYSASKAAAEHVVEAYRHAFFETGAGSRAPIAVASARAGNVIGGGDWTPDGLIADLQRALEAGRPAVLRYPGSVRPWQHVLEPLAGYLLVGAHLMAAPRGPYGRAWNFGPRPSDEATVEAVTERYLAAWGAGSWVVEPPPEAMPEAGVLRLSSAASTRLLGWRPRWHLDEAVARTAAWYRRHRDDPTGARAACEADIEAYLRPA